MGETNRTWQASPSAKEMQVGDQTLKIQVPHRISFAEGDACKVRFVSPMWNPAEDEATEKERQRRQLV